MLQQPTAQNGELCVCVEGVRLLFYAYCSMAHPYLRRQKKSRTEMIYRALAVTPCNALLPPTCRSSFQSSRLIFLPPSNPSWGRTSAIARPTGSSTGGRGHSDESSHYCVLWGHAPLIRVSSGLRGSDHFQEPHDELVIAIRPPLPPCPAPEDTVVVFAFITRSQLQHVFKQRPWRSLTYATGRSPPLTGASTQSSSRFASKSAALAP